MIRGLAHVCIVAPDLEAAEQFYCQTLGLERAFRFLRRGETVGLYLRLGQRTFIEVFRQETTEDTPRHPIRHFCLEVDDLDATVDRLKAAGQEVTDKTLGADRSWQAWTTDPAGVRIEFHQYTDQSTQLTGADCIIP